jgi:hypothetical protein
MRSTTYEVYSYSYTTSVLLNVFDIYLTYLFHHNFVGFERLEMLAVLVYREKTVCQFCPLHLT